MLSNSISSIGDAPMDYEKAIEVLGSLQISDDEELQKAILTAQIALSKLSIANGGNSGSLYSVSYEGVLELHADSLCDAMDKARDRLGFIVPHNEIFIIDGERVR